MCAARYTFSLVLAIALVLLAAPARADVYKCQGDTAVPVYQETPCAKGRELRNFQTDPPEITILPAQPRANAGPARPAAPQAEPRNSKDARPGKSGPAGDASERRFIHTGMSEAEVLGKLGRPDITTGSRNAASARWIYMPAPSDPETITSLTLTNGTVTDVERKIARK